MEEKSVGTPNPLNPGPNTAPLDANPSDYTPPESIPVNFHKPAGPTMPAVPVDPMIPVRNNPSRPISQTPEEPQLQERQPGSVQEAPQELVQAPTETLGVVTDLSGAAVPQPAPNPIRPMEKAIPPEVKKSEKKRKKKIGLLIGMVISLLVAIGCGVAALVIMLNNNREDTVAIALGKLVTEGAPNNISVSGDIKVGIKDKKSAISGLKVTFNGQAATGSLINNARANLEINLRNGKNLNFEINEIYAANGELFLKVDGLGELAKMSDENSEDASVLAELKSLGEVDGKWIRIPLDDLSSIAPLAAISNTQGATCAANLAGSIKNSGNTIAGFYNKNPFITSTTEDLTVISRQDPVYRVTVNSQALANFLGELSNTAMVQEFLGCANIQNVEISTENVERFLQEFPETYVEIDENYQFTRLYLSYSRNGLDITADFNLGYPTNINVSEPVKYTELRDIIGE